MWREGHRSDRPRRGRRDRLTKKPIEEENAEADPGVEQRGVESWKIRQRDGAESAHAAGEGDVAAGGADDDNQKDEIFADVQRELQSVFRNGYEARTEAEPGVDSPRKQIPHGLKAARDDNRKGRYGNRLKAVALSKLGTR